MDKVTLTSKDSPQQQERMMTLKEAADIEHVKRTESANKVHSRVSAKKGETSPIHNTPAGTVCVTFHTMFTMNMVNIPY